MKILTTLLAVVLSAGLSACAVTDDSATDDPPQEATAAQAVSACDNCIDTAQRDGNYWLIAECIRVVCAQE